VNDESRFVFALQDAGDDFVEGDDIGFNSGCKKL